MHLSIMPRYGPIPMQSPDHEWRLPECCSDPGEMMFAGHYQGYVPGLDTIFLPTYFPGACWYGGGGKPKQQPTWPYRERTGIEGLLPPIDPKFIDDEGNTAAARVIEVLGNLVRAGVIFTQRQEKKENPK